jgi:hypothetical protein
MIVGIEKVKIGPQSPRKEFNFNGPKGENKP